MKEYIEREAVLDLIGENDKCGYVETRTESLLYYANNIPAADVEEVRHGEWIHGEEVAREYIGNHLVGIFYDRWTCSECGYVVGDHKYFAINYNFCPNCGAKMNGGVNDAAD